MCIQCICIRVCAHLCVCKCRPHLPSTHLKVRTQDLSLLSAAHGCVCWRGGQHTSMESCQESTAMTGTPPRPAWRGSWSFACTALCLPIESSPTFVSLYLLLLLMDFMDLCRVYGLRSLNGGDTSGQGVARWLVSCYEQYREYWLDVDSHESNTWCTLHIRSCCWHSTARWSSLPSW